MDVDVDAATACGTHRVSLTCGCSSINSPIQVGVSR